MTPDSTSSHNSNALPPSGRRRAFLRPRDLIVVIVLLAISLTIWLLYAHFNKTDHAIAAIYYENKLEMSVPLRKGQPGRRFSLPEHSNVVFETYSDGSIAFVHSDCPDQVCVHTGKIRMPGQFAACLPNKIMIKILRAPGTAAPSDAPDLVIGGQ